LGAVYSKSQFLNLKLGLIQMRNKETPAEFKINQHELFHGLFRSSSSAPVRNESLNLPRLEIAGIKKGTCCPLNNVPRET
jgi:hypothetical protein